jgi:hypothetical protein
MNYQMIGNFDPLLMVYTPQLLCQVQQVHTRYHQSKMVQLWQLKVNGRILANRRDRANLHMEYIGMVMMDHYSH